MELLKLLRGNARITLADASRITGVPKSTLFDWLRELERTQIKRYVSLYKYEAMKFLRVYIVVVPRKDKRLEVVELLRDSESVNTAFRSTNTYVAELVVETFFELNTFVEQLSKVARVKEYMVLETVCVEEFFSATQEEFENLPNSDGKATLK